MAITQIMVGAPLPHSLWCDFAVLGRWLAIPLVLGVKFLRRE